MCGIAGGFALAPGTSPDAERVRRITAQVAHRGPDADGFWDCPTGRVSFGHRRLSVIDLANGQQPMVHENGRLAIVFNGEIYNYRELRAELEREGIRFMTQSDTEVLLKLYERRGTAAVDALRGMFAFAIWNADRGEFVLGRDRIGKKPLYYVVEDGVLYFSSSIAALRATTPRRWSIDMSAVDSYLTLGYIPAPRTIYEGVQKLEAATLAIANARGVHTTRYWDLAHDVKPFTGTFEDAVDHAEELLATAVRLRLRSDVPLGVFLSGGIDSSLVTAIAMRHSSTAVRTFSIGFDVAAFDESSIAAQVASQLGTDHRLFRVDGDVLRLLPSYVQHFGEPFADSSALPQWILAQKTREHVTVALGGDGGDEGFGGYNWYRTAARLRRVRRLIPGPAATLGSRAFERYGSAWEGSLPSVGRIGRALSVLAADTDAERFAALRTFISRRDVRALYDGELAEWRRSTGAHDAAMLAGLYRDCEGSALRRMRYVDIRTYLADCLMPKVDVATMAHGLEARAPLLDHELVTFALSVPDEWLIDEAGGKRLLRALLARHLPAMDFTRPKQGFTLPVASWIRSGTTGAFAALADSERLRATGWLQADGIRHLIDQHVAGLRDNTQRLFNFLVLDEWLKLY